MTTGDRKSSGGLGAVEVAMLSPWQPTLSNLTSECNAVELEQPLASVPCIKSRVGLATQQSPYCPVVALLLG